jgi:hypothetical protein
MSADLPAIVLAADVEIREAGPAASKPASQPTRYSRSVDALRAWRAAQTTEDRLSTLGLEKVSGNE